MTQHERRRSVTAIILALDEEAALPGCLDELDWADEVLVVDSGSTDATADVARARGARVFDQPWLGWSAQRNAGAAAATHDWVFVLEADEIATATLRRSITAVLAGDPDPRDAWAVDRRDEFWGELLPQTQRATKQLDRVRLYHRDHSRWDESMLVHEEVLVEGAKRLLEGPLLHWRPQTLEQTAERIVRYAPVETAAAAASGARASVARLVALPVARFLWLYLVKRCYRHGTAGLVNSVNRAHADFLRLAGLVERERPPTAARPPRTMIDV